MIRYMASLAAGVAAVALAGSAYGAAAPAKGSTAATAKPSKGSAPAAATPSKSSTSAAAQSKSPTSAAAASANGSQVIHAVGIADLQQFVLQRGDTVVGTGSNGTVNLVAKSAGGITYQLIGTACSQPGVVGCESVFMQVKFKMTPTVTDATLSQANTQFAAIKVWKDGAGTLVGVSRYVVLHGGVTRQNVADNIELLLAMAPAVARVALGQPPAAAPAPASQK